MTLLQTLQTDLKIHNDSLKSLEEGKGGFFIRREGLSIVPLMHSYRKIIASIEAEIALIMRRTAARKAAKTK